MGSATAKRGEDRANGPRPKIARNIAAGAGQPYAGNGSPSIPSVTARESLVRLLFEHRHRGDLWRLEVTTFKGRDFANWRRWYQHEGELRPTKEGCTFPLERLADLQAELEAYHAPNGSSGHSGAT